MRPGIVEVLIFFFFLLFIDVGLVSKRGFKVIGIGLLVVEKGARKNIYMVIKKVFAKVCENMSPAILSHHLTV